MGRSRRCAAAFAALTAALAAAGCGGTAVAPTTSASSRAGVTPSVGSPEGALAGFLAAARNQDEAQVPAWLATGTDVTDLAELLRVYSGFGTSGGLYWAVGGVTVISATADAGRARVTLSGDVVWCLGKSPNDPAATCSVVNHVPGLAHTYGALQVGGRWKADIDINASSGLDHNPQASPTAGSSTSSTPTPT